MCQQSKYAAILIEHLKDVTSINHHIKAVPQLSNFIGSKLLYILYQVYMPLSILADNFTHYDLHMDNVLLYKPVANKHIEYHYHVDSGIINFKSEYIVKLIDYGRSYYNQQQSNTNPIDIYNKLCTERSCDPNCGENVGLAWLEPVLSKDGFFISSSLPNPSHDLRLINEIKNNILFNVRNYMHTKPLIDVINSTKYGVGITDPREKTYGSQPNINVGFPLAINNVRDAEMALANIILNNNELRQLNDNLYFDENKIGDFHIYSDGRPMKFVPIFTGSRSRSSSRRSRSVSTLSL